jgi:hypothetical protein
VGDRISQNHLLTARNAYYRVVLRYWELRNRLRNAGHGQWNRIAHIDPAAVEYITHSNPNLEYGHGYLDAGAFDIVEHSGAVVGGSWDRQVVSFEDLYVYQALANRINSGTPWEETSFFEHMNRTIQEGETPWGCASTADRERRCRKIENLYYEIRQQRYRSQRELGKLPVDEVTVNVGRNGAILFNDGRHRLATAKLLELDAIPVRILVVHEEFIDDPTQFEPTNLEPVAEGDESAGRGHDSSRREHLLG